MSVAFLCPNCGQPDSRFNPQGFAFGKATSWRETIVVLGWTIDGVSCTNCKQQLHQNPNIGYLSPDTREILAVQSDSADNAYAVGFQALLQWLQKFHCDVRSLQTLAELRSSIRSLGQVAAKEWNAFLTSRGERNEQEHMADKWRLLTPQTLSLTYLGTLGIFGGIKASADSEDFHHFLAELQLKSWLALAKEWISAPPSDTTFEEDLEKYLRPESVLDGVADLFSKVTGALDLKALGEREQYCMEALFATVSVAAAVQNPRSALWGRAYVKFEMTQLQPTSDSAGGLAQLSLAPERIQKTLNYRDLWDAAIPFAAVYGEADEVNKIHERLSRVAEKAGHPGLLHDFLLHGIRVDGPSDVIIQAIIDAMGMMREQFGKVTPASINPFVQVLLENRDIVALKRLADEICAINGPSPTARAQALAWLGSQLKILRMPTEFLAQIGDQGADWEEAADPVERAQLWVERSNHLRLAGHPRDALAWIERALPLVKDASPEDQRVVFRNYAILLRENGDLADSAHILAELKDTTSGNERIELLESLALTLLAAGDTKGADSAIGEIRPYFNGLPKSTSMRLRAFGALLLRMSDREDDAISELLAMSVEDCDGTALIAFASAWASTVNSNKNLYGRDEILRTTRSLLERLNIELKRAQDAGDSMLAEGLAALTASLLDDFDPEGALQFYELSIQFASSNGTAPPLKPLLRLTEQAFVDGNLHRGRSLLAMVPSAFRETYKRLDLTLGLPPKAEQFGSVTNALNRAVISHSDDAADWRTSLDATRDTFSRAEVQRAEYRSLSDDAITHATAALGAFSVVEWIRGTNKALVTMANAEHVTTQLLTAPLSGFSKISERVRWRLANWTEGRKGDPLDLEDWNKLREWLNSKLSDLVPSQSHLVLIDNESTTGMPWHLALGHSWSVSYAPSWFYLLGLSHLSADRRCQSLGIVSVPRFADGPELVRAMEQSDYRAKALALNRSIDLHIATGTECDNKALVAVFGASDIARVVCHGFVHPHSFEVAWMVAASGQLPLSGAIQLKNPLHKRHIVGWRDLLQMNHAPQVVFSGACSSGFQHVVGVGEQLGIFFGLRSRGTRSFIAPHWDVVGHHVLPVLDRAMEIYLEKNDVSLAAAVRHACLEASEHCKPWLAWAIAVEGDWR